MTTEIITPINIVTNLMNNIFLTDEQKENLKPEICSQNFMDSLEYIENFIKFIYMLETVFDISDIEFSSTFMSLNMSQKLGINIVPEIYELRLFEIVVNKNLVESEYDEIEDKFLDICDDIKYDGKKITFILKG